MSAPKPCTVKPLPSQAELKALLEYDPESGVLLWKERPSVGSWNSRFARTEALATKRWTGHKYGYINYTFFSAHRVIWKLVYGEDPDQIDHINGDASDNRLINLRSVSHKENGRNVKLGRANSTGRMGVYRRSESSKWQAAIQVDGRLRHLGTYSTFDEACAAREAAEKRYGFHANHGRAAA